MAVKFYNVFYSWSPTLLLQQHLLLLSFLLLLLMSIVNMCVLKYGHMHPPFPTSKLFPTLAICPQHVPLSNSITFFGFVYLFIYLFWFHNLSTVSPPASPPLFYNPIHSPSSVSLHKRANLPWISTNHAISSCNETRHLLSYQVWMR